MDKNSNSFVMTFAVTMCVVLAVVLAGTFEALKGRVAENQAFDQQVNVLKAVGLYDPDAGETKTRSELEKLYAQFIRAEVLEVERGMETRTIKEAGETKQVEVEVVKDMVPAGFGVEELEDRRLGELRNPNAAERKEFTTFFTRIDEQGEAVAYCIPVEGLGLWGMIYGYLALEADLDTVKGITFFRHKETPGLGGEIDAAWWKSQWKGKTIFEDDDLVSVTVKKGRVDTSIEKEREHYVDGLSGATITSNGVTNFVRDDLAKYQAYFAKLQ